MVWPEQMVPRLWTSAVTVDTQGMFTWNVTPDKDLGYFPACG